MIAQMKYVDEKQWSRRIYRLTVDIYIVVAHATFA